MKSHLDHLQVNIDYKNVNFYKNLLKFLGWQVILEDKDVVGFKSDSTGTLWFTPLMKKVPHDHDSIGINHIGLWVDSIAAVDKMTEFLKKEKVTVLFDTPRHRPEFSGENDTYYQVMFHSPDKILFEVVYTGPK